MANRVGGRVVQSSERVLGCYLFPIAEVGYSLVAMRLKRNQGVIQQHRLQGGVSMEDGELKEKRGRGSARREPSESMATVGIATAAFPTSLRSAQTVEGEAAIYSAACSWHRRSHPAPET